MDIPVTLGGIASPSSQQKHAPLPLQIRMIPDVIKQRVKECTSLQCIASSRLSDGQIKEVRLEKYTKYVNFIYDERG